MAGNKGLISLKQFNHLGLNQPDRPLPEVEFKQASARPRFCRLLFHLVRSLCNATVSQVQRKIVFTAGYGLPCIKSYDTVDNCRLPDPTPLNGIGALQIIFR